MLADMVPVCLRCYKPFPTNVTLKLCLVRMFGLDVVGQGRQRRTPVDTMVAHGQGGLVATALKGTDHRAESELQMADKMLNSAQLLVTETACYDGPIIVNCPGLLERKMEIVEL